MNNLFSRIPYKFWAYLALTVWGVLSFFLLHKTNYGIDEGAARGLLLVWSVADNVISPIITLGLPDFRAVFFVPVGSLWTGNIVAAKIFTLLIMSCAVWAIHRWRQHKGNSESALIASGLLLISPLLIDQLDSISVAPFLLVTFALGAWLDFIYRDTPHAFGGVYFSQLVLCLVSVTLHPVGLAYPLALLWAWHKNPLDAKHKKYFFIGVIFTSVFALLLTLGWDNVTWLNNPFMSLSSLLAGSPESADIGALRWIGGIVALVILLLVIWKQAGNLWSDFLGRILLIALIIGMFTGDETWGIVVLTTCLYWGLPMLLRPSGGAGGFWGQRGTALILLVIISTAFMNVDKVRYQKVLEGKLVPRDNLIKSLVENTGSLLEDGSKQSSTSPKKTLRIASQWPGRTMLACQCDTLALPPAAKDAQSLLALLHGINYLIFDPRDPANSSLSHNLAMMDAGKIETVELQSGGVIVEIKDFQTEPKP